MQSRARWLLLGALLLLAAPAALAAPPATQQWHESVMGLAVISPDGTLLAAGTGFGAVGLFRTDTGKLQRELVDAPGTVDAVTFSPDGSLLAAYAVRGAAPCVQVWRVADGTHVATETPPDTHPVRVAFSPDNTLLAVADNNGSLSVWRTRDWGKVASVTVGTTVSALTFEDAGHLIALGLSPLVASRWDCQTDGNPLIPLGNWGRMVRALLTPDAQNFVAFQSPDAYVQGALVPADGVATPRPLLKDKTAVGEAIAPDGKTLAVAHAEGTVTFYRLADGVPAPPVRLTRKLATLVRLSYTADGQTLAVSDATGTLLVSALTRFTPRTVLTAPTPRGNVLALSPDGAYAAWKTATGVLLTRTTDNSVVGELAGTTPSNRWPFFSGDSQAILLRTTTGPQVWRLPGLTKMGGGGTTPTGMVDYVPSADGASMLLRIMPLDQGPIRIELRRTSDGTVLYSAPPKTAGPGLSAGCVLSADGTVAAITYRPQPSSTIVARDVPPVLDVVRLSDGKVLLTTDEQLEGKGMLASTILSSDGSLLITGQRTVRRTADGVWLCDMADTTERLLDTVVSADNQTLLRYSDKTLATFDARTGKAGPAIPFTVPVGAQIQRVGLSSAGRVAFMDTSTRAANGDRCYLWRLDATEATPTLILRQLSPVSLSPDGRVAVMPTPDAGLDMADTRTGEIFAVLPGLNANSQCVFAPDASFVITVGTGGTACWRLPALGAIE